MVLDLQCWTSSVVRNKFAKFALELIQGWAVACAGYLERDESQLAVSSMDLNLILVGSIRLYWVPWDSFRFFWIESSGTIKFHWILLDSVRFHQILVRFQWNLSSGYFKSVGRCSCKAIRVLVSRVWCNDRSYDSYDSQVMTSKLWFPGGWSGSWWGNCFNHSDMQIRKSMKVTPRA